MGFRHDAITLPMVLCVLTVLMLCFCVSAQLVDVRSCRWPACWLASGFVGAGEMRSSGNEEKPVMGIGVAFGLVPSMVEGPANARHGRA